METEDIQVRLSADTTQFTAQMREAQRLADGFGSALSSALTGAVTSGGKLDGVLKTLLSRLSKLALNAALKPIENALTKALGGALGGAFGGGASITPFAKGGVFGSPQMFGFGGGGLGGRLGVMGEAGPEAVMPLARDGAGRLGVRMQGGHSAPNVTVNVTARDLESFRRAEADVAASVSRAVSRGQRNL